MSSTETARNTLETWLQNIPQAKRADIRGRFRGDDRQHAGALLELATHEILRTVASNVQLEPAKAGGYPDFLATYRGTQFIVECTVAQPRDNAVSITNIEDSIKAAIDSIDTGYFRLMWETRATGNVHPPTREFRKCLSEWISSLDWDQVSGQAIEGLNLPSMTWKNRGWKLEFKAIPIKEETAGPAIGIEISLFLRIQDHVSLKTALETKADE